MSRCRNSWRVFLKRKVASLQRVNLPRLNTRDRNSEDETGPTGGTCGRIWTWNFARPDIMIHRLAGNVGGWVGPARLSVLGLGGDVSCAVSSRCLILTRASDQFVDPK